MFTDAQRIYFMHTNDCLKKQINDGQYPFLGLYAGNLSQNNKDYIQQSLSRHHAPIQACLHALWKWPALFSTYLTAYVLQGFGNEEHAAVWRHLETAISPGNNFTPLNREELWVAYRGACRISGLPVLSRLSGSNYMVNEFLHQAGVPLAYVDRLIRVMLRYTNDVGLADDDDPDAIRLWRFGLLVKLNGLPRAVSNAITDDDTGFYSRLFADFYRTPNMPANTPLEQKLSEALSQALAAQSQTGSYIFSTPHIVWRDDILGIELPISHGVNWQIHIGEQSSNYTGLNETLLVRLSDCLASEIKINRDGREQSYPLWTSSKNNALLLFDNQGFFVDSTDLTQDNLALEPGRYIVLSRFPPDNKEDVRLINEYPELYQWEVNLSPGETLILQRGPAQLQLQADSKPVLTWQGNSYKPAHGQVFFASKDLILHVQVPREWVEQDAKLILHLVPGNLGEPQDMSLHCEQDACTTLDLESCCQMWQPGFTRLLVELRHTDSTRPLARTAIHLWNGLQIIGQGKFNYTAPPKNLDKELCDNFKQEETRIGFKEDHNRFFRLTFKLSDKRQIKLTCAVPGIFLYLEKETDQGWREKPLRKGSTLAVGSQRRDMLRIYSSESGELSLGELRKRIDARHNAALRLPLSSLDSYLTPQNNTLEFRAENTHIAKPLLKLITPQQVIEFEARYDQGCYRIDFSLGEEIEALSLHALNLLNGDEQSLLLNNNDSTPLQQRHPHSAWLSSTGQGKYIQHNLSCLLDTWSSGAWLLNLQIKHQGRWKSLSNPRQDAFAAVFLLKQSGLPGRADEISEKIIYLNTTECLRIFQRVQRTLLPCYAPEAWDQGIKSLLSLWHTLIDKLDTERGYTAIELIKLAAERPPDTADVAWIPLRNVAAWLPQIYAQPATDYRGLRQHPALLPRCLGLLSYFPDGLTPLFQGGEFYPTAAAGFDNFIQMQTQGIEPHGFDLNRYHNALNTQGVSERLRLLNQEDWQPDSSNYLGALHYLHATQQLYDAYKLTLGGDDADDPSGNHWRRGQALRLIRELRNYTIRDFVQGIPAHWATNGAMDNLSLLNHISATQDEQEQENLEDFIHALSLFAQVCRWEVRQTGGFNTFIKNCEQLLDSPNTNHLVWTYLFYVGEAVFGFYLLLWEMAIMAEIENETENQEV